MVSVAKIGVNLRCDNVVETGQTTLWMIPQRVAPGDTSRAPESLRFNWTPAKYREGLVRAFLSIPSRRGRMSTIKGGKVAEEKMTKALETYQLLKSVVTLTIFGSFAIVCIDFITMKTLTCERSAYEAARPLVKLILFEIYWTNSVSEDCRIIDPVCCHERNGGISIRSLKSTRTELRQGICITETATGNEEVDVLFVRMSNQVPQEERSKQLKQSQKRNARKKSFFGRLEEARNGACRGLPV